MSGREPILLCWSGGKDSAMTLHALLQQQQFRVAALLTTVTEGFERISMAARNAIRAYTTHRAF